LYTTLLVRLVGWLHTVPGKLTMQHSLNTKPA
jgi:hypothetical protein